MGGGGDLRDLVQNGVSRSIMRKRNYVSCLKEILCTKGMGVWFGSLDTWQHPQYAPSAECGVLIGWCTLQADKLAIAAVTCLHFIPGCRLFQSLPMPVSGHKPCFCIPLKALLPLIVGPTNTPTHACSSSNTASVIPCRISRNEPQSISAKRRGLCKEQPLPTLAPGTTTLSTALNSLPLALALRCPWPLIRQLVQQRQW